MYIFVEKRRLVHSSSSDEGRETTGELHGPRRSEFGDDGDRFVRQAAYTGGCHGRGLLAPPAGACGFKGRFASMEDEEDPPLHSTEPVRQDPEPASRRGL